MFLNSMERSKSMQNAHKNKDKPKELKQPVGLTTAGLQSYLYKVDQ